ncbi:hypothetical protein [Salinisphaera orenii]|uniref:hypothetical protein n=1 Tax=Salinisphaera orenii TaxID=856731 RepID=UPI000DBE5BAA
MTAVTAREIAIALNRSRSIIHRRAKKEGWPYKAVKVRGGTQRHYIFAQLPPAVQKTLHGDVSATVLAESDALIADLIHIRQRLATLDQEIAALLRMREGAGDD